MCAHATESTLTDCMIVQCELLLKHGLSACMHMMRNCVRWKRYLIATCHDGPPHRKRRHARRSSTWHNIAGSHPENTSGGFAQRAGVHDCFLSILIPKLRAAR
jgi:hypothetical protein